MGKTKSNLIITNDNINLNSAIIDFGIDNHYYERYNTDPDMDLHTNKHVNNCNAIKKVSLLSNTSTRKMSCSTAEPVTMSWHNINVFGKTSVRCLPFRKGSANRFHILKNVSGEVKPGQLLAIMGASGTGKSTLINVLTQRNLSSVDVKGTVTLNGKLADVNSIIALSAYVQQDDLFFGTLTVSEHLEFASLVRMHHNCSKKERQRKVGEILEELNLMKCKNTVIGSPGSMKGISGGERKRLAFASELMTNPSLMFCDEPTSGLDSFSAQNVVEVLKYMAESGRTVVCTIHQPSSAVFSMFDQLLLMADGRVAYMGKLEQSVEYFASLGLRCPTNYNPADFYINELAIIPGKVDECREKIKGICDHFLTTSYAKECLACEDTPLTNNDSRTQEFVAKRSQYKANWFTQLRALTWRASINALREPLITTVRIVQTLVVSALLGLIYWRQDYDHRGVQNMNGAIFVLTMMTNFQNSFGVIHTFCSEISIFLREHNNGMYRVDTYFLAKQIAEFPSFTIIPILFVCPYYYMIGLNENIEAFYTCICITLLLAYCSCSYGYCISCVAGKANLAESIGPALILPMALFGGYFLNNDSVPVYFLWLKYISWFYYGNELLMINQWSSVQHIECAETVPFNEAVQQSNGTYDSASQQCLSTGKMILEDMNFEENNFVRDILLLVALTVVMRIIAYIALLVKSRNR